MENTYCDTNSNKPMDSAVAKWLVDDLTMRLIGLSDDIEDEKAAIQETVTSEELAEHAEKLRCLCEAHKYYNAQLRNIGG